MLKHSKLPEEEKKKFQAMWNNSSVTMDQLCREFKIAPPEAHTRAKYLRAKGMDLVARGSTPVKHRTPEKLVKKTFSSADELRFQKMWNNPQTTLEEICQEFNMIPDTVYRRAAGFRKKGVELLDRGSNRMLRKYANIENEFIKLWQAMVPTEELIKRFHMTDSQISRYVGLLRYKKGIDLLNRNKERSLKPKLNPMKVDSRKPLSGSMNIDTLSPTARTCLEILNKEPQSLGKLSSLVDRSKETVEKAVQELYDAGFDAKFHDDTKQVHLEKEPGRVFKPLVIPFDKNRIKFGLVSDTHFGSKFQQVSLLKTAYEEMEKQKVSFCLHTGDVCDGQRMYRGQEYEVFLHGSDEQRDYAAEVYPKASFKTYMITGNHDDSFKTAVGHNIIRSLCTLRPDLIFRGELQASVNIGKSNIYLLHPLGGVSYAKSYKIQKIAESITAAGLEKARELKSALELPQAIFMGHWHIDHHFMYQGMLVGANPCFQAQTPFLKRLGLSPNIGFAIMEIWFDDNQNIVKWAPQYFSMGAYVKERDY